MFNVLPDVYVRIVKNEYYIRRFFIILLAFLVVQISFLIFLLPSWVNSDFKEKDVSLQMEDMMNLPNNQNTEEIFKTIESINNKLDVINTDLEYPKIIPILNLILSHKVPGVTLGEISYTFSNEKTANIRLSGTATSRDALVAYKTELQKIKTFTAIDVPISNFSKEKNIEFSVSIIVAQ